MPHDLAARGYEREAHTYARARPSYPPDAVDELCRALGLADGDRVVELGAGTGIFTRQLLQRGLDVVAVEPVTAMRGRLRELLPSDRVSDGSAEATGLPDGTADAVLAATAWHWFDADRAIAEVRRLLRSPTTGGLGLIWNGYDRSVPWVAELADISNRRRPADAPGESSGAWRAFFADLPGWLPLTESTHPNPWRTDPAGILDRILSGSVIAALPSDEQSAARKEAQDILAKYGLESQNSIELAYVTRSFWTRPTASRSSGNVRSALCN
jgi:SAM-dependent methyltransferase